ncbi:phage tail tube protein [Lacticaseibacillus sharpeae]|uniref:Phage core tail protein n=1 Tax=Lacticaseibacillus sharpeae JCM 1186 = DSM 20505 TaxID=1291052 RepID=A0A0R1ZJF8_9LACO|nr:phage tail tube protein [Lacticaseibacillus sharpeae]KRM54623.1 phage core tail protein [Lacticaseibacillus sharpeae JCM 1186 = DSM 20505]
MATESAAAKFLEGRDTINSKDATIFMTIDDTNYTVISATELTAKIEKNKESVNAIGDHWTRHKTTSIEGTGSFNRYTIDSVLLQKAMDYIKGGADLYFSINATIEDKTSRTGKQTILITGVNLDDINLLSLSSDDGVITDETDFTFEGCELVTPFDGIK